MTQTKHYRPLLFLVFSFLLASLNVQAQPSTPVIDSVWLREVSISGSTVTFTLEINGKNYPNNAGDLTSIRFSNAAGAQIGRVSNQQLVSTNKIVVTAEVPVNTEVTAIRLTTANGTVESSNFRFSFKPPAPPPTIKSFEIKHVTRSSAGSPIKSLLVTNEEGRFASSPHRMSAEILPAGASNILIRSGSNPYQMVVDFIAPEKFEIQDVVVTVYDSADLDKRQPIAIALPFKEKKPPSDPNQPSITKIETLYLQRDRGIGRFKIEGSGFGNFHRRAPLTAEQFLSTYVLRSLPVGISPPAQTPPNDWIKWQSEIHQSVKVTLVPRNAVIRVERSEVLYIDDKLIDLYVEFTKFNGYSQPFRAASATVTVKKPGTKPLQVLKAEGVVATIEGPETYIVSREVGPKRDENLTYEYTVLDATQASHLFGSGIADNFYAVKLSVVNRGEKKVSVPLASIQAEIEWASGEYPERPAVEYFEGPETQTPIPLEDVSGFFDAFVKSKGRKAKLFNILSGVTTFGAALIPFVGPGVKDAHVVFTGGLIPGLRQGFGDLSGQQLQNLTARTWETIEVISDRGGSVSKYVFFQRGEQIFSGQVRPNIHKLAMNIRGVEITGFEVTESEPKVATKQ
ncbi:MAG TPA: hypothetical protein VJU84_03835 [Pyrinomonadaceae bacterium]|nr:hypothetical protein [Pyrinomonadaceae bacterium]